MSGCVGVWSGRGGDTDPQGRCGLRPRFASHRPAASLFHVDNARRGRVKSAIAGGDCRRTAGLMGFPASCGVVISRALTPEGFNDTAQLLSDGAPPPRSWPAPSQPVPPWERRNRRTRSRSRCTTGPGQFITSKIMGEVLKKAGYNVEYVQADYLAQFAGLKTGDLTLAMEIWATTGQEALDEAVASGKVENLGETGMVAKEEWWFPEYMKEKCPGLPNWEALKEPACAEAFSIAETAPKGRYLGGPGDLGRLRRGAGRGARPRLRGRPRRHRRRACSPNSRAPISGRRRSCSGSTRRTGRRRSTRASGSSSRTTRRPATPTRPGASTRTRPMTAASRTGPIWKAGWVGIKDKWPGAYKAIKELQPHRATR